MTDPPYTTLYIHSVEDAIEETVHWRRDFGISKIDLAQIKPLLESGMAYVSPTLDKHGRTVIMIHVGRNVKVDNDTFLKFMMYTIER